MEDAAYYTTSWIPLAWDWSQDLEDGQRFVILIQDVGETVILSHTVEGGAGLEYSLRSADEGLGPGSYVWLVQVEEQVAEKWRVVAESELRSLRVVERPPETPTPVSIPMPEGMPTANDIWNFQVTEVSNREILVTVDYSYNGLCNSNGEDFAWIAALLPRSDGQAWISSSYSPVQIRQGYGTAAMRLQRLYETSFTTDQVRVVMYGCQQDFYSEVFAYTKTWSR